MKPTEFLVNEGNQHCAKCKCNTSTTLDGTCKLCGTKKLKEALTHASNCPYNYGHDCTCGQKTETHDSGCDWNYGHDCNCSLSKKKLSTAQTKESAGEGKQGPFEAHGIRGLDRKPWRKTFKNVKQLEAYCERWDAEVYGTRDLEAAKRGSLSPAMGINEVKSGEIANHPWVCRRAKIKGTGEVGEVIRVCREPTFSQMVPWVTMVWVKLDSGETKEVRKNHIQIAKKTMGIEEEGGRWEYDQTGKMREIPASQAAAHAKANLERMSKKPAAPNRPSEEDNVFESDGGGTCSSAVAGGAIPNLFGGPQKRVKETAPQSMGSALKNTLSKVEPGSKLDHKIKSHNRAIKAGMPGTMTRAPDGYHIKKNGMITLGESTTKKVVKESSEAWRNYYDSADEFAQEILAFVQENFGGQAWFKGGSYAYKVDSSKPNQLLASDGSPIKCTDIVQGLSDYCDSGVFDDFTNCDPSYWNEYFRPVKSQPRNNQADHETANLRGESKQSNMLKGITLAEYSTAAQRAEADRSYQEFIAKGGKPKPAPNKKYKEPAPGTTLGSAHIGGRSEMASGKHAKTMGKKANRVPGLPVANESQLNEYKPKIIPKTLAGGKLNPNHPGNAAAIANEKEAKYKRQEQIRQERSARAARQKQKQQKAKAQSKGQKIKASLGSAAPTNPLEEKAKDAMWKVWNAIAPDMMQAIRGGGYEDDESLIEDPYYVAEVCCDANHMQTFAHLSPEEEREILDNLSSKTLARLASDFGI